MCRHMRAVVNLALDALACRDGAPGGNPKRNQLMAAAMRLRYGLDDNKPRTLKEVSAGACAPLAWPLACDALCRWLCITLLGKLRDFGPSYGNIGAL